MFFIDVLLSEYHIYDGGDTIEPKLNKNDIIIFKYMGGKYDRQTLSQLQTIVNIILKELNIRLDIDFEKIYNDTLNSFCQINYKDSLEYKYPDIAKQWDYENNGDITPSNISFKSTYKAHWIDEYGHK